MILISFVLAADKHGHTRLEGIAKDINKSLTPEEIELSQKIRESAQKIVQEFRESKDNKVPHNVTIVDVDFPTSAN